MKNRFMTALLTATMIVSMTACGNTTTTDTTDTVETTIESGETTTVNDKGTPDNQIATLPLTDEEKPVVTDTKEDPKTTADPKSTEAPKSTVAPKTTEAPTATSTPKTNTQANATTTAKPTATAKPVATTAPKSTATPKTTTAPTSTPKATTAPTATPAPKATEAPKATVAPTAAPVACQHKTVHYENGHDTFEVPISGGCYEVWVTDTKVCNDCGANLGESQRKVNEVHTNVVHKQGVSPTCTTDGYSQVCGCDCGSQPEVGGEVIPATGHAYHDEFDHMETDADGVDHNYFHSICYNCGDVASTWEE